MVRGTDVGVPRQNTRWSSPSKSMELLRFWEEFAWRLERFFARASCGVQNRVRQNVAKECKLRGTVNEWCRKEYLHRGAAVELAVEETTRLYPPAVHAYT
jgi:hypothetical protein